MSSAWHTISIKDLGRVVTGRTPSSSNPEHFGCSYPFITPSDISLDNRHIETERYVSEEGKESLERILLPKGAICFVCIGATIGKICVTSRPSFTNQQINSVIVDESKHDSRFAFYALALQGGNAKALAGGAATPIINKSAFSDIEIEVPDLPTQRKIAVILSAYDDLIENNLRRIKILEEMAQSLYREWFVHFRFPGHESVKFVESELGQIPEGWEVVPMGDFVQFKSGFAFKSSKFVDGGEHRLVTIKNVQDGVFNPVSDSLLDELPEKLPSYCILEDGDILLSLTGNVGRVCLVYDGPFLLNQRVAKLVPISSSDWMLAYCVFRSSEMRTALEMLSNGVAQQNLSPVQATKIDFPLPPEILRERFASIAEPIGHHVVQLYNANQNLRRTRDLLLPKLLSNENR